MTSESKILTVSYGTFSCTLEGFDDPFNTMKAIAEYFRDLTAEDRYFGAEPPQPDAAMLHRIAEREVSRLVDTRVSENGVRLRPRPAAPAPVPTAPGPAVAEPERRIRSRILRDEETVPPPEPTLQDEMPEGVVAKLARIRRSVPPPTLASDDFDATEGLAWDQDASPVEVENIAQDAAAPDLASPVAAPAEAAAAVVDTAVADAPIADAAPVAEAAEAVAEAIAEAPAVADAVADAAFADAAAVAEDHPIADAAAVADATAVSAATAVSPDDDTVADDTTDDLGREALNRLDALLRAPVDDTPLVAADIAPAPVPDSVEDVAPVEASAPDGAAEAPFLDTSLADALPEEAPAVTASLTEALAEDPLPEEAVAEPAEAPVAPPKTSGRSKRVNSRVVRLHPGDETSEGQGTRPLDPRAEDAEVSRLLRQADDVMANEGNRRRIDSIAHLKAAVAATEADRAITGEAKPSSGANSDPYRDDLAHVVQPDPQPVPAAPPTVRPRRKTVSVRPQEPRPGTIRPGVMGPPPLVLVSEQRIDRTPPPQPPVATPVPAPAAAAPQPIVAVPGPRDSQPMVGLRTGRLTGAIGLGAASASPFLPQQKIVLEQPSQSGEPDDEDGQDEELGPIEQAGLVNFAERLGVKSMAELLEAAAAYATCIEKRSQFTRPQLMRRLMASAGDRQVTREDGLRSFGTLLRTGRIEKVSRGHYVLAESSPYLAEARRQS